MRINVGRRDVRQPRLINLQHLPIQKQKCTLPVEADTFRISRDVSEMPRFRSVAALLRGG
jgi:hypothetical protein